MRNAGLDETQAGIKIAWRNINNLRYADDTTLMVESEEELKILKCNIHLGRASALAPSIQYRASNLDWQLVSYMIFYMFQCHSPKSSHPLPLPQSP